MPDLTAFLIAVGPLAIGVTKAVDFVRGFDREDTWPKWLWIVLSLALGVGLALLVGANFANLIEGLNPSVSDAVEGTLGQVVTGLAIGATASFWHEHLDRTSSAAKARG